ncbi:MAG: sulfotransferase family protein [Actinomycetota bacterium]
MALQVIGAGLGRTGTLSLKAALEELGFGSCYHMIELLTQPEQVSHWEAASRRELVDWDALFTGYRSAVDYPACRHYRELMEQYPEAKVILTVRDPHNWWESVRETIYQVTPPSGAEGAPPAPLPFPGDPQLFARIFGMVQRDVWGTDFEGRFEDREYAVERFNRHTAEVREHVPADRLLVYQVKEGWGPLCEFLGAPAPEGKPFPRLNDREEFRKRLQGGE